MLNIVLEAFENEIEKRRKEPTEKNWYFADTEPLKKRFSEKISKIHFQNQDRFLINIVPQVKPKETDMSVSIGTRLAENLKGGPLYLMVDLYVSQEAGIKIFRVAADQNFDFVCKYKANFIRGYQYSTGSKAGMIMLSNGKEIAIPVESATQFEKFCEFL